MGVTLLVMRAAMPRRTALSALPYFNPRLVMGTLVREPNIYSMTIRIDTDTP
ncbi:hypothetical protein HMPREF9614_01339 [Cutibacterium acnes HL002PA2]|nr:hypothetical protein HMPREF9580_00269 [Cutibacterium acnes HL087PA2]EFS58878.1 hypothetical protein HMPREF9604_01118 [Cutibacterium acnes HL036PA1]EFS61555.1 hypothetical protein HMPREF9605_01015 [Cutibacterium acnes HL036PA2]EFS64658.1 hypothetical protein HMPREF9611_00372 [Cutibacterium acnes HL063PA1]EFS66923.1 hypothetical protein HMPREF9612_00653 [Cutibacterium acnes HL063PA2]EFS69168.1 hypothetical protein HMPREF9616_01011 [Cutibacterium acnes HL007PA1]EFS71818.1 hypothetical protein